MKELHPDHPRYHSLTVRERMKSALSQGIIHPTGLIAHGRGEAFDYLLQEKTHPFATAASRQAAALLQQATHPVLSINGNAAALCPSAFVELSQVTGAALEVNLFHYNLDRAQRIKAHLESYGATHVLLPNLNCEMPGMASQRRFVHPRGLFLADVIFVPLEDGDRAQALQTMGRTIITVDLNPLSRTAQAATVNITDNLTRALPQLIQHAKIPQKLDPSFDNHALLRQAERAIRTFKNT